MNPLLQLRALGQSVWLDYIDRPMLTGGVLARLIADDGIAGVTSNPTIFQQAITGSAAYRSDITAGQNSGAAPGAIIEGLMLADIGAAADLLRPLFEASGGEHGLVSIEVSPRLAHDCEATIAEAHRLWSTLARPNVLIKVPATREGLDAVRRLTSDGVNINVTLIFGLTRNRSVAEAYIAGLEDRLAAGRPIATMRGVASFFLSRIDTAVDKMLAGAGEGAQALRGRAAIALARIAYGEFLELIVSPRWRRLADAGAAPQRLLWASTGTKDPAYPDTLYIDALVGPDTVTTVPPATLEAFRDHGRAVLSLTDDPAGAAAIPTRLAAYGINLDQVAQDLERDGVGKFVASHTALLGAVEAQMSAA